MEWHSLLLTVHKNFLNVPRYYHPYFKVTLKTTLVQHTNKSNSVTYIQFNKECNLLMYSWQDKNGYGMHLNLS